MALQIMPRLLSLALDITGECRDAYILVATSGDTGKAALEGYRDVPRVKIKVFYPVNGVSNIQKKQMSSQTGENVDVVAINGNFDDAQTGVKRIFSDENCRFELAQKGWFFSSANSINWGRLVPQIVYYISAYCDLLKEKQIKPGEKIDIVVPTGNFGNIFAAYAAKQMLLPVARLVCASNRNDVLAEFINTGVYDKRREFHTTVSPSMDILVSSNLERLLYWKFGAPAAAGFMKELAQNGFYKLNGDQLAAVRSDFSGFSCTEEETKAVIAATFKKYGYLCDTHTAVALGCAEKYRASAEYTGGKLLIATTASPYKFAPAVLSALGESVPADDFAALDKLHEVTKVPVPGNLAGLKDAPVRFTETVDPADMQKTL
jgi:threonine synthase